MNASSDDGSFPYEVVTFDGAAGVTGTYRGNVRGSSNTGVRSTILLSGAGTLNVIGDVVPSTGNSGSAIRNTGSGTLNITGNITGGGNASGTVVNASSGYVNVTGDVSAATSASCLLNSSTGIVTVTGSVSGGASGATNASVNNSGSGTVTITGAVTGGVTVALSSNGTGSITHVGTVNASSNGPAINGATGALVYCSGPFIGTANGIAANVANRWRWIASVGSSYMTVPNSAATGYKNLYTTDYSGSGSGQPATSNVRSGTVYGPSSELTGTCAVPAAGSVALGVAVDNTTGTAVLTQADVRTAVGLASANLDTQLDALPTAAETATAVRTELTPELSRISNTSTTQEVADIVEGAFNT